MENKCIKQKSLSLLLTRSTTHAETLAAAQLTMNGALLAFIPASSRPNQEISVQLPVDLFNNDSRKKLTLSYLDHSGGDLGILNFESSTLEWKLFAKRDGTPIGKSKNLYLFKGNRNEQLTGEVSCISFE
jgi:hypothetical protein